MAPVMGCHLHHDEATQHSVENEMALYAAATVLYV